MTTPKKTEEIKDFTILFDQLNAAKEEQPVEIQVSLEQDEVLRETMSLFNEYQNSKLEASFSTLTVS